MLDMLAAGASVEDILADYEFLEPGDIAARLRYASERLDHPLLNGAA